MEKHYYPSRVLSFPRSFSSRSYDKLDRHRPCAESLQQTDDLQHRRSRRRCFAASVCGLLGVIAIAALGTALAVRARRASSDTGKPQDSLSEGSAAIAAACNATMFPDLCYEWLSADPGALKASPLRLAGMAVKVALDHSNNASALASKLRLDSSDGILAKQAVEDCIELMELSSEQLNQSIARLGSISLLSIKSSLSDVKVLLSGTMGFQLACAEGLVAMAKNSSALSLMQSQDSVDKAVSISLGLVDALSKLGADLTSWRDAAAPRLHLRRLLVASDEPDEASNFDHHGLPDWACRRLLQAAASPSPPAAANASAPSPPSSAAASSPSLPAAANASTPSPPPPQPALAKITPPSAGNPPSTSPSTSVKSPSPPPPSSPPPPPPSAAPAATPGSYNAVVAQDGSGTYKTITEALANVPSKRSTRYVIYIKKGVYQEFVAVPKGMKLLTLIGDGIGQTVITGNKSNSDGITTYQTATVAVAAPNFIARKLTIRNTAGPQGHQAVALRVNGDQSVFDTCSFEGYQDTLYALANRQFYTECTISGTIDFIFGNAIAVFQDCTLVGRQPLPKQFNTFTAQGRKLAADPSGYSFQKCTVQASADLQASPYPVSSYYGRPWQAYSRTVFLESAIGQLINPAGWVEWDSTNPYTTTVYYGEYLNTGPGASTANRVAWKGVHPSMSAQDASAFTVESFIAGSSWLPSAQVAFQTSL